ncbi:ribokinase [Halobacillus litoralis]|nr:ribokinase [Halobacillus litoralis]
MKILNYGSLNIDKVYRVPHFVREGETLSSLNYSEYCGGKGLNQSIALSRAGADVYHAGKIGPDGAFLLTELQKNGVHTEFIEGDGSVTGHAIIQVTDTGENSILLFGGANKEIGHHHIDHVLSRFEAGDLLVLQNEINDLDIIIEKGYKKGMFIALNPSPMTEPLLQLDLSKITYLIVNEVEGERLTGHRDPEKILASFHGEFPQLKVVLTLGAQGVIYQSEIETVKQKSFQVDVIDTTAAGDTFLGYFLSGIFNDMKTVNALRIASKAASIAVSREGAASSIPHLYEVEWNH